MQHSLPIMLHLDFERAHRFIWRESEYIRHIKFYLAFIAIMRHKNPALDSIWRENTVIRQHLILGSVRQGLKQRRPSVAKKLGHHLSNAAQRMKGTSPSQAAPSRSVRETATKCQDGFVTTLINLTRVGKS